MTCPSFQNGTKLAEAAAGEGPHLSLPVMLKKKCKREITFTTFQPSTKYTIRIYSFIHAQQELYPCQGCRISSLCWKHLG